MSTQQSNDAASDGQAQQPHAGYPGNWQQLRQPPGQQPLRQPPGQQPLFGVSQQGQRHFGPAPQPPFPGQQLGPRQSSPAQIQAVQQRSGQLGNWQQQPSASKRQAKGVSSKRARWVPVGVLAGIVVVMLIAIFVIPQFGGGNGKYVAEARPELVRVIDLGEGNDLLTLIPMNETDPMLSSGTFEFFRFKAEGRQWMVAIPEDSGKGWRTAIPEDSGNCGLDGEVLACTSESKPVALTVITGEEADKGEYEIGNTVDEAVLENVAEDTTLPSELSLNLDAHTITAVNGGEIILAADANTIAGIDGDRVLWQRELPEGSAELNSLGAEYPRLVIEKNVTLYATPKGIIAVESRTGETLWSVEQLVDAWFVDGDKLYVQHAGEVFVYDLTLPESGVTSTVPAVALPAPALPPELTGAFVFSSGAGGWMTSVVFDDAGSFEGKYINSDYGSVFMSYFHGIFEMVAQIDDHSYRLNLAELGFDSSPSEGFNANWQWVEYGQNAYGFEGDGFILFTPGAAREQVLEVSDEFWLIAHGDLFGEEETLSSAVLVSVATRYAFVGTTDSEGEPLVMEDLTTVAELLDGKWCPTDDSNNPGKCLTISGEILTYDNSRSGYLDIKRSYDPTIPLSFTIWESEECYLDLSSCDYPISSAAPVGEYYPAGQRLESWGSVTDRPEIPRIYNSQTGNMYIRQ